MMNEKTILIDSAEAVARKVQAQLSTLNLLNNGSQKGLLTCYVTDIPMRFETVGKRFLGSSFNNVQTVHAF